MATLTSCPGISFPKVGNYDSVPSARYSSVCNVLRQWRIWLIPTYRVYRLYDFCACIKTSIRINKYMQKAGESENVAGFLKHQVLYMKKHTQTCASYPARNLNKYIAETIVVGLVFYYLQFLHS